MGLWEDLAAGRPFLADISAAPRRRAKKIRAAAWSNYTGYDPGRGTRPRCRARGCTKHLRRDQPFACSPEHAQQVIQLLEALKRAVEAR